MDDQHVAEHEAHERLAAVARAFRESERAKDAEVARRVRAVLGESPPEVGGRLFA